MDKNKESLGRATGFVCFNEHLFITNQHVIDDAYYLQVESENGNKYYLNKVVASDKTRDVALLLFPEGIYYKSLEINTLDQLMRGQKIVTIGNPIGFKGTIAFGNISAFPVMEGFGGLQCIQFTAPISHGSSGGCLFDDKGKVIGITSAGGISEYTGEKGENIGLAVPISVAKELYDEWDKNSYTLLGNNNPWNTNITSSAYTPSLSHYLNFVPGAPTASTFEGFQTYFTTISTASGYAFTWDAEPAEEDGYTVYSAVSEDETLKIRVYVQDGSVAFIQADGAISLNISDFTAAQKFGEWFGVAISGGVIGLSLGAGDVSIVQDPDLEKKLKADIEPLVYILENDFTEEKLAEGKAAVSTVFGYPCGLEVSGSIDGATVLLAMKIIVSGPEGRISVK